MLCDIVDIVFLKTWFQVEVPNFYNPVSNLLMPQQERGQWKGLKTVGMLRKEKGVKAPYSQDSQYQKVTTTLNTYTHVLATCSYTCHIHKDYGEMRVILAVASGNSALTGMTIAS